MGTYSTDKITGGTASVDVVEAGDPTVNADKACDNNGSTYWSSGSSALPHWWKYDFGAAVTWKIRKLTLSGRDAGNGLLAKNFVLASSPNNSDWTTVYTGLMANSTGVQTFTFGNANPYRYYRITFSDNYSGVYPNYTQIFEVEMMITIREGGFLPFFL